MDSELDEISYKWYVWRCLEYAATVAWKIETAEVDDLRHEHLDLDLLLLFIAKLMVGWMDFVETL